MSTKGNSATPSKTAMLAAFHRALAHKDTRIDHAAPDHLAIIFLPFVAKFLLRFRFLRNNIRAKLDRKLPGLHEFVVARTLFFDELFKNSISNSIRQVVILGAGYDTRAYRFESATEEIAVFEIDNPETQKRKVKCLKAAGISVPEYVKWIPADLNVRSIREILITAGFDRQAETLFMLEGLSYYLELSSFEKLLKNLSEMGTNSIIAFDYLATVEVSQLDKIYGAREFYNMMSNNHPDEQLRFTYGDNELEEILKSLNMRFIEQLKNDEIEQLYLKKDLNMIGERITGVFRFALVAGKQ